MPLPDVGTMQTATLALCLVASVFAVFSLVNGLYSAMTGKDPWPARLRRLRRRAPASEEDQRTHGFALVLNSCGVLMMLPAISLNTLAIGVRTGEPANTMRFLLTVIGMIGALACVVAAHSLSTRVTYLYRDSPATESRISDLRHRG